jgi:hypothetical protein
METQYQSHVRSQPWNLGEEPWEHSERYPPLHTLPYFTKYDGKLVDGNDIYQNPMSLAQAEHLATTMPGCVGFTFMWQEMEDKGETMVYFKSKWDIRRTVRDVQYMDEEGHKQFEHIVVDPEPWWSYKLEIPKKGGGGRMDGLMKKGNVKALMKWIHKEEQDKAWAVLHCLLCTAVALAFFFAMIYVWFAIYHTTFFWSVFILFVLILIACVIILFGSGNGKLTYKQRKWVVCLGITCILTTILGTVLGFIMYFQYLAYYFRYLEMRAYTNVGASQAVSSFNDGDMFLFTMDTRLDVMRSIGHRSKYSGNDMCVAPLVDKTMSNVNPINFWAAGDNCCLARSQFMCDDAKDANAMSALVMLEPDEVVRPFMTWAVRGAVYPRYVNAIMQQESAYATRAADKIRLVYWVKDPIAKRDSFYYDARRRVMWFGLILCLCLLVVTYAYCYYFRDQKALNDQHVMQEFVKQKNEEKKVKRAQAGQGGQP